MELIAKTRTKFGKQSKSLSYEQKIPAVLFGKGLDSIALEIDAVKFGKVYKEAGETSLVTLKLDDGSERVLIKDVQFDHMSLKPMHAGFYKVNLKEKTRANIPVHVINTENNPLVKSGEGLILTLLNEISVEALPAELPHSFEVDAMLLTEIGQAITVAELNYDKTKVEIMGIAPEEQVVKLDTAHMAEEVEEVAPLTEEEAIAAMEATAEKKPEEGEEGTDGAAMDDKSKGKEDKK